MWEAEAGPGFVPWCVPTEYHARYVRGTSIASDWSSPSIIFASPEYTNPVVSVAARPGFQVRWGRSYPAGAVLLDCIQVGGQCTAVGTMSFVSRNATIDLSNYWIPGQPRVVIAVNDFINAWNANNAATIGQLSLQPNGIMLMSSFFRLNQATTVSGNALSWWRALGFSDTVASSSGSIQGLRPPNGNADISPIDEATSNIFTDSNNPCTTINPPDNVPVLVGWGGSVGAAGNRSEFPWCQPTSYRWSFYDPNTEMESDPSEPSALVFAPEDDPLRHTPILAVRKPAGMTVRWYRNDNPQFKNNWVDHTHAMERHSANLATGEVRFTDIGDNPCNDPYRPPAPADPPEGEWSQAAGEGVVPWCIPTRYHTRYANGNMIGDWSQPSAEFYSLDYTYPSLTASTIDGFDTQWGRSDPTNPTIVFNCLAPVGSECNTVGVMQLFFGHFLNTTVTIDLSRFWNPDQSLIVTTANEFIDYWNTQHGLTVGRLDIQPNTRLRMSLLTQRSGIVSFGGSAALPWLSDSLGFNSTLMIADNGTILASRPPNGPLIVTPIVGAIGEDFIDFNNPCVKPNRPAQAPNPVGWNRTFAR